MERIVALLEEKNHYLEKFYSINEKELVNFAVGNFESLDSFYNAREKIIQIIQYLDHQIDTEFGKFEESGIEKIKSQVKVSLKIKDEYVARIIEQDVQVLSCIEAAKNSIIKELRQVGHNKKAVGGYKSPEFKNKINREV